MINDLVFLIILILGARLSPFTCLFWVNGSFLGWMLLNIAVYEAARFLLF